MRTGRRGIVYAVSIDHARNIAAYYSGKGLDAAAIDSHTPTAERGRMVEDFKTGRIKVLVNVDVFSEGFDCPDVEFVQMARPTLSLAKYLQQAGRGLRKSTGKETCVLIDNVGLYRVFRSNGRDWVKGKRKKNGQEKEKKKETSPRKKFIWNSGMGKNSFPDRLLSAIAFAKNS